MNLYLAILKLFLNTKEWITSADLIDQQFLKDNAPDIYRVFQVLPILHKDGTDVTHYSVADLELAFYSAYPASKKDDYNPLFKALVELEVDPSQTRNYLGALREREIAGKLAVTALAVAEGHKGISELLTETATINERIKLPEKVLPFVDKTLAELEASTYLVSGLRWRLGTLNRYLGSLRKGDFGFLFARPETGKTTFLASEITEMAKQTDRPILWFNNEEQGDKVLLRCIQAHAGVDLPTLFRDKSSYEQAYLADTGKRIRVYNEATLTKRQAEEIAAQLNPSLMIFDQIDGVKGFANDRLDIELKEIYTWARELAKMYCPVIGVCQAGGSGDGKRWLTMNDVDNSKTGKQGSADWILGIGKVFDEGLENVRFFHLSKNKLMGDPDAEPSMRHGKWEVRLRGDIARYEDF